MREAHRHPVQPPGHRPAVQRVVVLLHPAAVDTLGDDMAVCVVLKRYLRIRGCGADQPVLAVTDSDNEKTRLITPPGLGWKNLKTTQIRIIPEINFRAAIIYLMSSLSISEIRSVKKPCLAPLTVTISRKNKLSTLDDIIREKHTTKEVLREMNDIPHYQHDGDILKYVPAEKKRVILGWNLPINAQRIALAYNGGGDPQYIEKIKYVYSIIIARPS